jgi:hypothetical protein
MPSSPQENLVRLNLESIKAVLTQDGEDDPPPAQTEALQRAPVDTCGSEQRGRTKTRMRKHKYKESMDKQRADARMVDLLSPTHPPSLAQGPSHRT